MASDLHPIRSMNRRTTHQGMVVLLLLTLISLAGCGKSTDDSVNQPLVPPSPAPEAPELTKVKGTIGFGAQCPYGNSSNIKEIPVLLWQCPTGQKEIEMVRAPQAILIQGDCKEKTVTVRTPDRKVDGSWKTMPDGTFTLQFEGAGTTDFKTDGAGHDNCTTHYTLELRGRLKCPNNDAHLDEAVIDMDTYWWLGKGKLPRSVPSPTSSCTLPAGCYLHTEVSVSQCK